MRLYRIAPYASYRDTRPVFENLEKHMRSPESWCGTLPVIVWGVMAAIVGYQNEIFSSYIPSDYISDLFPAVRTFSGRTAYPEVQLAVWSFLMATWPVFSVVWIRACGCRRYRPSTVKKMVSVVFLMVLTSFLTMWGAWPELGADGPVSPMARLVFGSKVGLISVSVMVFVALSGAVSAAICMAMNIFRR